MSISLIFFSFFPIKDHVECKDNCLSHISVLHHVLALIIETDLRRVTLKCTVITYNKDLRGDIILFNKHL